MPAWFHSDQGSEYTSELVRSFLLARGSMNSKSAPWCIKVEFGDFEGFDTDAELLEEIYHQIHYFTFERIKTRLRMAPAVFREV